MDIVTRAEWGARPPSSPLQPMPVPTSIVYIHHSASSAQGPAAVRGFQEYHMDEKEMRDIAYNWLIDLGGVIYQGRGWGKAHGGNTGIDNRVSHSICLMLNGEIQRPTAVMLNSLDWLLKEGKARGSWLLSNILGHRQESGASTACPGGFVVSQLPAIRHRANTTTPLTPSTPPPTEEDPDMLIIDSDGKPAIALGFGEPVRINSTQRNALRTIGVDAKKVDNATSDAIYSIKDAQ